MILIDFETRSEVDLTKCGRTKYLAGRDADIIMMGYKVDDQPTKLWKPGMELPDFMQEDNTYYAFNAQFDMAVWNTLGPKYKFPLVRSSQWIDVMALCGRFTYHQSLEKAGEDLELKIKKNPRGKALINKISCPPYEYTREEFREFEEYCKDDIRSMYEMLQALPASKLSDLEQQIWELTVKINQNGLPIDVEAAKVIYRLTETYKEQMNTLLPDLTGGLITKATQNARIVKWLQSQGVKTNNLQAATVEKLLKRLDLSDRVRTVLQLRQELGRSSTAKYLKLIDQAHQGRIYDNLRYYGAATGRWGGMGFQLHNLPRSKVTDAQPIIDSFYDMSVIEGNPVDAAKSIVRGMICAPKGKMLCFADYTGIENRTLAWVADDQNTLQLFRDGLDQYKDMAAYLLNIPYEEITDEQRYMGKQLVLGCIGENTPVLTNSGWKTIQNITISDLVYDGKNFVKHTGIQYQGKQKVNLLNLTNDHLILSGKEWKESWQLLENIEDMSLANKLAIGLYSTLSKENIQNMKLNALGAELSNLLMLIAYIKDYQRNAEIVEEKLKTKCLTLMQELLESLKKMSIDLSTEFMQLGQDVINRKTVNTRTMEEEELNSILNLLEKHLLVLLNSMDGINQNLSLIESIMTDTMKKEICNLLQDLNKCTIQVNTYDVTNAGLNKRFMILSPKGLLIVHNCGFGLGWKGFMKYMDGYGTPIDEPTAIEGVGAWRRRYNKVVNLWYACKKCASLALNHPGIVFHSANIKDSLTRIPVDVDTKCKFKVLRDRNKTSWLSMTLPSGRALYYNKPEFREGQYGLEVTAMGINPYSKKWQRLKIIPGRFVENIVQATARDILAQGKLNLDKAGYKIIGSVHDEVIIEDSNPVLDQVIYHMCSIPSWADGLPLAAEGVIEKRYRKM